MSRPAPPTSQALKRAKRDLRRSILASRDALAPAARARMASMIAATFLGLPEVGAAKTVMAFWSFGSEVPTTFLIGSLHDEGVVVALPRIAAGDLVARRYEPGDPMTETSFGALEPSGGALVDPGEIDVVLTPAVVFDRSGARVGYGGGFYDRFLPRTRPGCVRVGIAFGVQVLPAGEVAPGGHFDLPVDVIVTESETIRCEREA